jgi:hypothetical protein
LARKYSVTVTFSSSPEVVLGCVADVFLREWHIPPQWGPRGVTASTGPSIRGWGEDVTAIVADVGPQGTTLNVRSESVMPLALIDWGRNRQNVQKLITQLGWRLAPGGAATYGPGAYPQAPPMPGQ